MDDHGAADDVLHTEAVRKKKGEGVARVAKEGRHIPGVLGMGATIRVIVAPNAGKGVALVPGAAGTGMDVNGEDRVAAWAFRLRQTGYMGRHDHAMAGLIETHRPMELWVFAAAPYLGDGRWPLSDVYKLIQFAHNYTSDHCMPGQRGLLLGAGKADGKRTSRIGRGTG